MMEWLTQRPGSLLSGWIMHMLIGLQKSHRYSVLIEITHGSLEKVSYHFVFIIDDDLHSNLRVSL